MPLFRLFHIDVPADEVWTPITKDARYEALTGNVDAAVRMGIYSEVAHIEAETIDRVFPLSNHIESDWTRGDAIRAAAVPARSTSMGDIVMDEDGALFSCAMVGWKPLEPQQDQAFRDMLGSKICTLDAPGTHSP
ncbi:hypothetical protein KUV57_13380 [Epibacterium sp. DP7N7-1]|nr:hypothetical protein [Epibacterium sp. DP7N7-1]